MTGRSSRLVNQHQRTEKGLRSRARGRNATDLAAVHWFRQHGYEAQRAPQRLDGLTRRRQASCSVS